VTIVLDRQSPYQHPEQSQAVVLGMVNRSTATSNSVRDWLSFLLTSSEWQNDLAPAVLYGLGRAGRVNMHTVLSRLDSDSVRGVLRPNWTDVPWAPAWHAGKMRTEALAYCQTVLDTYRTADRAARKLKSEIDTDQIYSGSAVAALLGGHI
jgi:hypothetical protein